MASNIRDSRGSGSDVGEAIDEAMTGIAVLGLATVALVGYGIYCGLKCLTSEDSTEAKVSEQKPRIEEKTDWSYTPRPKKICPKCRRSDMWCGCETNCRRCDGACTACDD